MNFKLRPATESDKAFLLALRLDTMVEHLEQAGIFLSEDEHMYRLNDQFEATYLVMQSDKKLGALKYCERSDQFEILQLQILSDHQGKGLGRKIVEQVIAWSAAKQKPIHLRNL